MFDILNLAQIQEWNWLDRIYIPEKARSDKNSEFYLTFELDIHRLTLSVPVDSDLSGRFARLGLMMTLGYPAKKHRHPQVGLQALKDRD